jgi:hypothetical protein|tara:strand:- start:999 stop:1205 length:207 start_codon:yes stop_codon:yes gene_type:complete
MNLRIENNNVFMCCGKAKCPSIKKTKNENEDGESMYLIKDDFGGQVSLSESQALLISEAAIKAKELSS